MKPSISPAAMKIALLMGGTVLAIVGESLQSGHSISDPQMWLRVITAVGALLVGKEALPRSGDIPVSALPLEWTERKTDPQ